MNELGSVLLTFVGSMLAIVLACVCIMACCQMCVEENSKSEAQSARPPSNHTLQTSLLLIRHNQEMETHAISSQNSEVTSIHQPKPPSLRLNRIAERDCFEINNSNPPYPTSSTSMPLPSTSRNSNLEYNSHDIHVGFISDFIASSSMPSTSRRNHTEDNTANLEQPPPSYAEAVLNRSDRE